MLTVHESTKDELVILAPALETLNRLNILKGLITRGLYIEYPNNKKVPHIIRKVPELTNDCVRFMKDGTVIVRWILKENAKWGDGSPIAFFFKGLAGLASRVVEFARLPYHDRAAPDDQYLVDIGTFWHRFPPKPALPEIQRSKILKINWRSRRHPVTIC